MLKLIKLQNSTQTITDHRLAIDIHDRLIGQRAREASDVLEVGVSSC